MQKNITFRVLPSEAANEQLIKQLIARSEGVKPSSITGFRVEKRSIDARSKKPHIQLTVKAFFNEPFQQPGQVSYHFKDVSHSPHAVVIVGAGPAGLFAALKLLELGIKPIIIDRGKDVR